MLLSVGKPIQRTNVTPLTTVEVFKTNVNNKWDAKSLLEILAQRFPMCRCTFDLDDCDRILRVVGNCYSITNLVKVIMEVGFTCELLD